MVFALGMLLSVAGLGQAYLKDIYTLVAVSNHEMMPDPNFPKEAQRGLRAFGITMVLLYLGIWAIKLSFLLFFKRLGTRITAYLIFWWAVLIVTVACGAASIGTMQYHCLFGHINDTLVICSEYSTLKHTYNLFKVSCILDVASDVLSKLIST